jgi:CRP-like cAMP-binding protein
MVLLEELENVSFLRNFSPPCFKQIAMLAQLKEYEAGTGLFAEGEDTSWIFIVLQGDVVLEIQVPGAGSVAVQHVGPGELLGWSPVLGLGPMTAGARALTRCRLAALDAGQIQTLCQRDPWFGVEFYRHIAVTLANRLSATRRQLSDMRRPRSKAGKQTGHSGK